MSDLIRRIDRSLLDRVSAEASRNVRRRINHNFHRHEEPVQRFLNAIEPGSYIRPHRHINPPKWEMFVCLRGRGASFVFDEAGEPDTVYLLDPLAGHYGAEIPPGAWHTIISLAPGSVFLEVKEGPFVPKHAGVFAAWAPPSEDPSATEFVTALERVVSALDPR